MHAWTPCFFWLLVMLANGCSPFGGFALATPDGGARKDAARPDACDACAAWIDAAATGDDE